MVKLVNGILLPFIYQNPYISCKHFFTRHVEYKQQEKE